MLSCTHIFILLAIAKLTSNSGVFYYNPSASRGNPIFHYYAESNAQCLRACYEESNCAVVDYNEKNGYCRLYREGTYGSIGAYVLSREKTDSKCITEMATSDITFQKIPRRENVTKPLCHDTRDVTIIQPYDREGRYRFFVTDSTKIGDNWNATAFKLLFSNKPGKNCTSIPVFHKADYRRLYFGEIYNVTGYYFYNAYAFADYCAPAGECLGKAEVREYVDENGDFFYDLATSDNRNLNDSGLNQSFFIVGKKFN